ncbi:Uncharacterised protein [uncultured archaeon]|nr:Uncharacterised protein [uncultured archaeon]
MPSGYDLKYVPPKKGDGWKPEVLAGALGKARQLNSLDPSSGKGLESLMNDFLGPEFVNFDAEMRNAALEGYKGMVNSSIGDYVIGNVKDAVGYVGNQQVLPLAINLPYAKRKAEDGKELSDSDKKYNSIVSAGDSLKKIVEAVKTKDGAQKELDAEFDGVNDFSKKFWLGLLGAEAFIKYRSQKAQRKLQKAIVDYGVTTYIKDALAISEKSEKELSEKANAINEKAKSELEAKLSAGPITPLEEGKIRDKYSAELAELQKKYTGLTGARQFLLNGAEEMPGLLGLVEQKYKVEETKKKAEAEKKKKEAEAKAKEGKK